MRRRSGGVGFGAGFWVFHYATEAFLEHLFTFASCDFEQDAFKLALRLLILALRADSAIAYTLWFLVEDM